MAINQRLPNKCRLCGGHLHIWDTETYFDTGEKHIQVEKHLSCADCNDNTSMVFTSEFRIKSTQYLDEDEKIIMRGNDDE